MPKELHDKLVRQAHKLGLTGDRLDAYVYDTLRKIEERHKKKQARKQARKRARRHSTRKRSKK